MVSEKGWFKDFECLSCHKDWIKETSLSDKGINSEAPLYSSISSWDVKLGKTVQMLGTERGKSIEAWPIVRPVSLTKN